MLLHEVLSTEQVPLSYRVAGLGSRFLALLADLCLIALLVFAGATVGVIYEGARGGLGLAVMLVWLFALTWGYFVLFEWLWHGQTPGKRLLGIRVVLLQGTRISLFHSAVRNVLRVADAWPTPLGFLLNAFGGYAAGFATAAFNREQRRLGDLAAGTLVVHVERKAPLVRALHDAAVNVDPARTAAVRQRLGRLDRRQKEAILDLCLRREQLGVRERSRLFKAVADHLGARFGLQAGEHESDEKFVLQIAAALVFDNTGLSLHDPLRV